MNRLSGLFLSTVLLLLCHSAVAEDGPRTPEAILMDLANYPHSVEIAFSEQEVIDHEVGLGALKKVRGVWRYKTSERLSGWLSRHTWQIVDGFSSAEVLEDLERELQSAGNGSLEFACDGRACGHSTQWANRVFQQRLLYGNSDQQRYRVYAIDSGPGYRLQLYGSARTADRHYLHADLLRLAP